MPSKQFQIYGVNINDLSRLRQLESLCRDSQKTARFLALDLSGRIHFGELEKAIHNAGGIVERDLVVRINEGYLFDDEIAQLYIVAFNPKY